MKPVISIVDELLEAGVNVTVYNGQLDLIVDTMGRNHSGPMVAVSWVELEGNWPLGGLLTLKWQEEGHFLLHASTPDLDSLKRVGLPEVVTPQRSLACPAFEALGMITEKDNTHAHLEI